MIRARYCVRSLARRQSPRAGSLIEPRLGGDLRISPWNAAGSGFLALSQSRNSITLADIPGLILGKT
jgi:hypothetical protein